MYKESYGNWSEFKKIKLMNGYSNQILFGEEPNTNKEVVRVEFKKNNSFQSSGSLNFIIKLTFHNFPSLKN